MINRELEPELMDDPTEAQAYDDMDHSGVNSQFVADLLAAGNLGEDILDLGTGTARIPIELCRQYENCRVLASDAAVHMLEVAKINVAIEGFEHRIQLHHGDSKGLLFEDETFDCVMSNSLIHHLPEPALAMAEMVRVLRKGGRLFVRDLMRPSSDEEVERLVEIYSGNETDECQQLFRQSLKAALTVAEFEELTSKLDVESSEVAASSDRHVTWTCVK